MPDQLPRCADREKMRSVRMIGAPTDVGASMRGASMGPAALRVADLQGQLQQQGLIVVDVGDIVGKVNSWLPPANGFRHLTEVVDWNQKVYHAVYTSLQEGDLPLLLGGDHCLAIGSISAVAQYCRENHKKLVVLWLDAHADANTSDSTPSGNIHGMPVACLLGKGSPELTHIGDMAPALTKETLRLIGIRSVDTVEKQHLRELGLSVYDMRYIDEYGMRATMQRVLADVDANTHLHVSFDIDFMDPSFAPGVGTAVAGGPTYREAQLCMEMIADNGCLASLDLMELNPACDIRNQTAMLMVDFVQSLFGKSTLIR